MIYDSSGHTATNSVKIIKPFKEWTAGSHRGLSEKRAFACAVNIMEENIAVFGGLREVGGGLERSGEMVDGPVSLPLMTVPRSGHGCVGLSSPAGQFSVLVAGGTNTHTAHASKEAEILK